jgi:DNA-binding HxlR family transcriptional regulator
MARVYNQHCGLAHALDLVGDRWTLLLVRELLAGPRRYTDLADGLVTVPTNLLADRLRQMEANGLIRHRRLAPPADSVAVYELTERGEGLVAPLVELTRWGMETLPPGRGERAFRAHWLVLALRARFVAEAARGLTEAYEYRVGDEVLHLAIEDGEPSAGLGPAEDPAVVVAADTDTFVALVDGAITPEEALRRGASIEGDPAALARMGAILPPRRPAGAAA